jgi:protein kinase-like protein
VSLASGHRLGGYKIVALIGAGGMGEVYRARDTKLNRDVALKVLPEAFALDSDRLARFKREAQVLASPNHPNIAAIHGFEDGPAEAGPYVPGVGAGFSRPVRARTWRHSPRSETGQHKGSAGWPLLHVPWWYVGAGFSRPERFSKAEVQHLHGAVWKRNTSIV